MTSRIAKSAVATLLLLTTTIASAGQNKIARPVAKPTLAAIEAKLLVQRKLQLGRLKAYRNAMAFPRNDLQPGMLNIFVDARGNLCAMANLIAKSGHLALVDRTVLANNFIQLGTVTKGSLHEWILGSGLTLEEVALIQEPDFFTGRMPGEDPVVDPEILWAAEQQRLRDHLAMVVKRLEKDTRKSVRTAAQRLLAHGALSITQG